MGMVLIVVGAFMLGVLITGLFALGVIAILFREAEAMVSGVSANGTDLRL